MHVTHHKIRGKLQNVKAGLFTLLTLLFSASLSQGVTSTCGIPAVPEGQQTTLTCHFSEDLSQLTRKFKVVHYFADGGIENVLLCYWSSGIAHCQAHRDYAVVGNVTDKVTLTVQRASISHSGKYVCHAFQSTPESDESCNFSLKKVTSKCNIPSVTEGQNATLTCKFNEDVGKLQMRVKVVHYTSDTEENVLLCSWHRGMPACQAKEGYTFINKITYNLHLFIPHASPEHSGAYQCHVYQSAGGTGDQCSFHVAEVNTTKVFDTATVSSLISMTFLTFTTIILCLRFRQGWQKDEHLSNSAAQKPTKSLNGSACHLPETIESLNGAICHLPETTQPLKGAACHRPETTESLNGSACHLPETTESLNGSACHLPETTESLNGAACYLAETIESLNGAACHLVETAESLNGAACHLAETTESLNTAAYRSQESTESLNGASCNMPETTESLRKRLAQK